MSNLKRIFTVGLMLVTVLSLSVVAVPEASADASAGDLIKMDGLSSVYYLGADGKRYVFPNEATYFSWYSDFSSVVNIPQSELESYPLGANVTMRPGTKLIKITTDPKVYAVESDGSLTGIADEAAAEYFYGEDWNQRIVDIADSFFTNYVVQSEELEAGDEYPEGSLVQLSDGSDIYYINADGEAQAIADESAFLANRFKWSDVITADESYELPSMGDEITEAEEDLADTSQGGGGGVGVQPGTGSGLTVALASDTPAAAGVPASAALVPFTKINLTAANDGDVTVKNITVTRSGIGDEAKISGVYIYDDEGNRLSNSRSINSSDQTATFNSINYVVEAGATESLVIRATAAASASGNHVLGVADASDITTNGASVSGSFPVNGNTMSLTSDDSAGSLEYELQTVQSEIKVGETEQEVAEIKVIAGSAEDIAVQSIAFTQDGTANPDDLVNYKLYNGSTMVAELASVDSDTFTMMFDEEFLIEAGEYENFSLEADIMGGVETAAIRFDIDENSDVAAIGQQYGYNVGSSEGSGSTADGDPVDIIAGELTVEIDGPASQEVLKDDSDVVLANLVMTTGGEQDLEVETFKAGIDFTGNSAWIENVELKDMTTGNIYSATDLSTSTYTYEFKVEDFTIPYGESNWEVRVDMNDAPDGTVFNFKMTPDSSNITAENQDGDSITDVNPGSVISGNNVTVQYPTLTVAESSLSDGTVVPNSSDVVLAKFTLEAGESQDIVVNKVELANAITTASNYTLVVDGEEVESGLSGDDSANIGFTTEFTVDAGETVTVYVYGDINSSVSSGSGDLTIGVNDVTADDSDVTVTHTAFNGRTISFLGSGGLTFSEDTSSPSEGEIFISSASGVELLAVEADASNEDVVVDDLKFTLSSEAYGGAVTSVELYQDDTLIATKDGITSATVLFTNLDATVEEDNNSVFMVKANLAGIGDGAEDTGSSSADISIDFASSTFEGSQSQNSSSTVMSITGQSNKVYASQVTVLESESQSDTLADGTRELLKFDLFVDTNEDKDAQLSAVTVDLAGDTGSIEKVFLYSGSTLLASTTTTTSGSALLDLVADTGSADNITPDGESYIIKATIDGSSSGDMITAGLDVNGGSGATDDIRWKDYSGGSTINWIDLDGDTTLIDNTIERAS